MAQRKLNDIYKNEEYMDDVVSSALLNLHKGAKKKREYIWASEKFSSLDSIWGDDFTEPENRNDHNITSNTRLESKSFKHQYCMADTKRNSSYRLSGSIQTEAQKMPNSCSRSKSDCSNLSNIPEVETLKLKDYSEKVNVYNVCERIKLQTTERNPNVKSRISDSNCEQSLEAFQKNQNSDIAPIKTENPSGHLVRGARQVSRFSSESVNTNYQKNKDSKSCNSESNNQRSKISNHKLLQKEKPTERVARKRQLSLSTSSLPRQKHSPTENQKHDSINNSHLEKDLLKTKLLLKIFKGDKVFDFVLEISDFQRIRKRYPQLQETFPETDGREKELDYSADAVKIVIGFLLHRRYDVSDARTAVEVLAAFKSWKMQKFYDEFKEKFLHNLDGNCVDLAYGAAVYYGLEDICEAYKSVLNEARFNSRRPYRRRKCCVSVSKYIEPREFCIPSKIAISKLNDNFNRDIRNEIIFKALTGSFVITGIHIPLCLDNERGFDSTNLEFFYMVKNLQNSHEEQAKVHKFLRSSIVINFNRSVEVLQSQTAEIVVETSIKPYLCLAVQESNFAEKCDESQFCLTISSNYKVENSNEKRFFIGRLLYYPKA